MQAHTPTIILVIALMNFVLAASIAAVGFRRKPELMLWSASLLLHGVAYVLFGLRGTINDFSSIVVANVAVSATFALIAEGLLRFLRQPSPRWLLWSPVALTAAGFSALIDDYPARLMLASGVLGFQSLLLVHFLKAHWGAIAGRGKYLFLASTLLMALVLLGKVFFLVSSPQQGIAVAASNLLNGLTYLIGIVSLSLFVIGLLLMSWERDERTIRESEVHMRKLFEGSSDAMLILDEAHLIDCNPAALELFGCTGKAQLLDLNPAQFSPPVQANGGNSEVLARHYIDLAMRESSCRFDWIHQRLDNHTPFIAEVSLSTIGMDGRQVLLALIRDISARQAQQQELERRVLARTAELAIARDEAEAANAVKTRFMSNVSHEMRTPMAGILGIATIGKAKAGQRTAEEVAGYFDKIIESGKRLHRLNESLLMLADDAWGDSADGDRRKVQDIPLVAWLDESIGRMEQTAAERRQHFVLEKSASIGTIQGDPVRLHQVLEHLLSNALRFSPEGTTVTVRLQDVPAAFGVPSRVRIQVVDQGCGVPEKEMKAIFEPFYESTRTASGAGSTGLGLALCKSIVLRHKGSLSVTNRPEGGAVFELTLPTQQG